MMSDQNLELWSVDIKDAFLQVPQKRKTYVKPPRAYEYLEDGEVWVLERLLPG